MKNYFGWGVYVGVSIGIIATLLVLHICGVI
jgi:hypothetical protein